MRGWIVEAYFSILFIATYEQVNWKLDDKGDEEDQGPRDVLAAGQGSYFNLLVLAQNASLRI